MANPGGPGRSRGSRDQGRDLDRARDWAGAGQEPPVGPGQSPRKSPRKSPSKAVSQTLADLSRCGHSLSYSHGMYSTPRTKDELERIHQRVVTAATRGALMGMTMRGGFHVLSYALRLVVIGRGGTRRVNGAHNVHGVAGAIDSGQVVVTAASVKTVLRKIAKDTVQYGMFLGSFSGGYVALEEGIALGIGRERTRGWRALVAGFVAGGSLILAGWEKRHTSLALYMALKGLTFLVRCGNVPLVIGEASSRAGAGTGKMDDSGQAQESDAVARKRTRRAWVRRLLAPTRFSQGDVLLMCLAMSQLGYSWIVEPSTLPVSMLKFLNKHGGQSPQVMDEIRKMCEIRGGSGASSRLSQLSVPQRLPQSLSLQGTRTQGGIPCSVVHPGQTCNEHAFGFFPQAYARAVPVYLPVYIVPALLIHRQKLLSDPEIWPKVVKGTLRSSLFLSLFCTLAWKSVCTAFQWHGRTSGAIVASSCWVAGLALLAEKKSRRMELSIYALSRAIESFGHCLVTWGYVSPPETVSGIRSKWKYQPRADVVLFSMAAAAICHCYSDHDGRRRDVFGGKYLNFFDFIFGNTGFGNMGRIRHVPTNRDLVALAGERMRRITRSIGNDLASVVTVSSIEDSSDEEAGWSSFGSSDDDELL